MASSCLLNNQSIFGFQNKVVGPVRPYRTQDEELPGVDGCRSYRLGYGCRTWTIRGRYNARNGLFGLLQLILQAQSLQDGQPYVFEDLTGTQWANCQLTSFVPADRSTTCLDGSATVEFTATVRQLSDDGSTSAFPTFG